MTTIEAFATGVILAAVVAAVVWAIWHLTTTVGEDRDFWGWFWDGVALLVIVCVPVWALGVGVAVAGVVFVWQLGK